MDAHVYKHPFTGDWMVSLRLMNVEIDEAGPFDDEHEAMLAARRSVYGNGQVVLKGRDLNEYSTYPNQELEAA